MKNMDEKKKLFQLLLFRACKCCSVRMSWKSYEGDTHQCGYRNFTQEYLRFR